MLWNSLLVTDMSCQMPGNNHIRLVETVAVEFLKSDDTWRNQSGSVLFVSLQFSCIAFYCFIFSYSMKRASLCNYSLVLRFIRVVWSLMSKSKECWQRKQLRCCSHVLKQQFYLQYLKVFPLNVELWNVPSLGPTSFRTNRSDVNRCHQLKLVNTHVFRQRHLKL